MARPAGCVVDQSEAVESVLCRHCTSRLPSKPCTGRPWSCQSPCSAERLRQACRDTGSACSRRACPAAARTPWASAAAPAIATSPLHRIHSSRSGNVPRSRGPGHGACLRRRRWYATPPQRFRPVRQQDPASVPAGQRRPPSAHRSPACRWTGRCKTPVHGPTRSALRRGCSARRRWRARRLRSHGCCDARRHAASASGRSWRPRRCPGR